MAQPNSFSPVLIETALNRTKMKNAQPAAKFTSCHGLWTQLLQACFTRKLHQPAVSYFVRNCTHTHTYTNTYAHNADTFARNRSTSYGRRQTMAPIKWLRLEPRLCPITCPPIQQNTHHPTTAVTRIAVTTVQHRKIVISYVDWLRKAAHCAWAKKRFLFRFWL